MSLHQNLLPENPEYSQVMACQFSSWYPTFSNLKADSKVSTTSSRKCVTIKSIVIKNLSPDFVPYVLSDGMILPLGATKVSSFLPQDCEGHETWSSSSSDSEGDEGQKHDDDEPDSMSEHTTRFDLADLTKQITDGIASLGGSVFPKLNWSAPRDAAWMNNGSLRCETPGDVYLLIKSSDFCLHDILYGTSQSFNGSSPGNTHVTHELVLRQWCNLWPSMEFRCFVANYNIIAISQRNHLQFFEHLRNDKSRIRDIIIQFYADVVKNNFASSLISDYVFDIYVDRNEVPWLLDFNVWGRWTESLLYTWDEILQMKENLPSHTVLSSESSEYNLYPELRIVDSPTGILSDPLSTYRAPIDAVDLATKESNSFENFMNLCKKPSQLRYDVE